MPSQTQTWRPKPRRRVHYYARIDTTSLTTLICLVFLAFFAKMAQQNMVTRNATIDLPVVLHATEKPSAQRTNAVEVSVYRTGSLFVAGDKNAAGEILNPKDIAPRLRSMLFPGVEKRVYLKADGRAKYGDVEAALDQIRYAGISNITIMAERRRDSAR
jgi:biopolymer transport protein TolR